MSDNLNKTNQLGGPRNQPEKKPGSGSDPNKDNMRRSQAGFGLSYLIVSLLGIWLFQQFILAPLVVQQTEIPYSEFKTKIKAGEITDVTLSNDQITGTMQSSPAAGGSATGVPFITYAVPNGDPTLIQELDSAGIKYSVKPPASPVGTFLL